MTPPGMVDEYNLTGDGWARFSTDKLRRFRLGRILNPNLVAYGWKDLPLTTRRVIFLMLNPSVADAWKPDRTVSKCCEFAARWGGEVCEVVNLFAFISQFPKDLRTAADRGDGFENDREILEACRQPGVIKVVAAWGNHGAMYGRADHVLGLIKAAGVTLHCLSVTQDGTGEPMHPLARGKKFIPLTTELEVYG